MRYFRGYFAYGKNLERKSRQYSRFLQRSGPIFNKSSDDSVSYSTRRVEHEESTSSESSASIVSQPASRKAKEHPTENNILKMRHLACKSQAFKVFEDNVQSNSTVYHLTLMIAYRWRISCYTFFFVL